MGRDVDIAAVVLDALPNVSPIERVVSRQRTKKCNGKSIADLNDLGLK
jgi:hypothetical protein